MGFLSRKKDDAPVPAASVPAPVASAPAAPVAALSLQDQFKEAAKDMRKGNFRQSLAVFEALSKDQDALVANKISRTMVAFFLAVNHVHLADDKAQNSLKVLETVGVNPKIDSKIRAEAFQILSTAHMNFSLRMKKVEEPEKQVLASAALEKAKAYAAKALAADPESVMAKLAAADVALHEGRSKDVYELMQNAEHGHVGISRLAQARVMEDICAYILDLDDNNSKRPVDPDDSSPPAGFEAITDAGFEKNGGSKPKPDDKPDDELGGPGGAGSRVPNPPTKPRLDSGATPPKTDEGTPDPRRPIVRERKGAENPIPLAEPS